MSEIQIEVNNTSDDEDEDDIIAVGGLVPTRVRIFPWWSADFTTTLETEGVGTLQFSKSEENFTDTLDLSLNRAGLWSHIYVTTKEGPEEDPTAYTSQDPNDTYIVAHGSPQIGGIEDLTGFTITVDPKRKICAESA